MPYIYHNIIHFPICPVIDVTASHIFTNQAIVTASSHQDLYCSLTTTNDPKCVLRVRG